MGEDHEYDSLINKYFHNVQKDAIRNCVMDTSIRLDGRQLDEIRPIWSEIDYLPGTHGLQFLPEVKRSH